MHTLAKVLLLLASAVTAIIIAAFILVGFFGGSENATFYLGWLSIAASAIWMTVASVLVLLMATTAKVGQARLIGERSVAEWGILALSLFLAVYLIKPNYSSVWRGLIDGWYSSPVLPILSLWTGLCFFVSSIALLLRHKWSLHFLLLAALTLFVRSNYETLAMFQSMPFTAFLLGAGIKNFAAMIVLASYVYLRRRQSNA